MKRLAVFALAIACAIGAVPTTTGALPPGVIPGPTSITGVVTDELGNPLADINVGESSFLASTITDVDGTYLLEGLTAGDAYTVFAVDTFGRFPSASAGPVVVSADGAVTVDIVMLPFPTASINGTITDTTGAPLAGILVTESQQGTSTTTAPDGTYTLGGIRSDGNTLSITALDPSGFHLSITSDQFFALSDGSTIVDLTMVDDVPSIVGTVTGPDGAPAGGVTVSVVDFALSTTTAPDGRFAFSSGLPEGTFTLSFDPSNARPDLRGVNVSVTIVTGSTVDASLQLARTATIDVTVTAGGVPASADVSVWSAVEFGGVVGRGTIGADGTVSVPVPTDGQYIVQVDSSTPGFASEFYPDTVLRAAATRFTITGEQHVAVTVSLEREAIISGTITMPDGTPGDFTQATAQIAGPTDVIPELAPCNLPRNTDPAGTYRIGCLHPSADWIVKVAGNGQADAGYYRNSQSAFNATRFAVNPGQVINGINVRLAPKSPAPTFIGTSQSYFVAGTTTKGVRVYGTNFPRDFHALLIDTSTEGVGPAPWITITSVVSPTEAIATVKVDPGVIGPVPIVRDCFMLTSIGGFVERFNCFTSGDATTKVGSISGKVTDNKGRAVRGANVRFTSADGSVVRNVVTGVDGSYSGTGLPPGRYTVLFEGTDTLNGQWWKGATTEARSTQVTVAAGKTQKNISAQLTRRGPVTATSVSPNGVPVNTPFDLVGTGLSAITGGFRVQVDLPFGRLTLNSEIISDTIMRVTDPFSLQGGTYDVILEWTAANGATKQTVCVQCLKIYGNLFMFPSTGDPVVVGTTTTLNFTGDGFVDLTSVTVDGVGVTVDSWTVNGPGSLDVTFTATADAIANPDIGALMVSVTRIDGATTDTFVGLQPAFVDVPV